MEPAAAQSVERAYSATPMTALDRRRHRRFPVALLGRFMLSNKQEFPCKLVDVSVTGIAVNTSVLVGLGERIVAYFDHLGGLEGRVSRIFHGGFGVELIATDHKREKLASQIEWLAKEHTLGDIPYRRHERIALGTKSTTLKLDEGVSIQVNVIDVSMSGASVQTEARPRIGTEVMVGKLRAKVVRHHAEGLGLEFIDIQNPDAVRRYFG